MCIQVCSCDCERHVLGAMEVALLTWLSPIAAVGQGKLPPTRLTFENHFVIGFKTKMYLSEKSATSKLK